MKRRSLFATTLALPALAQPAWPERPIRFVVPFAAGTSTDIIGRLIAQQISAGLGGHAVVVDNRAGAGGTIGAQNVASSPPDGHSLLLGTIGTHAVNPHLMRNLGYDPARDFAPVVAYAKTKILLVVRPQLGPRSVAEFLELGRRRTLSIGSPGTGTSGHLAHALLGQATGVATTHVPYRDGGRALTDLLSGTLDAMIYHTQFVRPHIEAGTILGLGITGSARSNLLPAVPTFAEAGLPAINAEAWWAVYAPAGLPPAIGARLNAVLNAALARPETLAVLDRNGVEPMGGSAEELAAFQARELVLWGEVVRRANITADS